MWHHMSAAEQAAYKRQNGMADSMNEDFLLEDAHDNMSHPQTAQYPDILWANAKRRKELVRQSQREFAGDLPFKPRSLGDHSRHIPQQRGSPHEYTGEDVSLSRDAFPQHIRRLQRNRAGPSDFTGDIPFQPRELSRHIRRAPPVRRSPPRAAFNDPRRPTNDSYVRGPPKSGWIRPAGTPAPMSMRKRKRDKPQQTTGLQPISEEERRYFYKMRDEALSYQREEAVRDLERRVAEAGVRIQQHVDREYARLEGLQAGREALELEEKLAREGGGSADAREEPETETKAEPEKDEIVPATPGKKSTRARKNTAGTKKARVSTKPEEKTKTQTARRTRRSSVKQPATAPTPSSKRKTVKEEPVAAEEE